MEKLKNFIKDEAGTSAVEYGLLIALIALAVLSSVSLMGTNLRRSLNSSAATILNP